MQYMESKRYISDIAQSIADTINIDRMKGKSILLTGATGLIGSYLADMIMYANAQMDLEVTLYVVGRSHDRLKARFETWVNDKNFHMLEHDVKCKMDYNIKVDYMVHGASNAYPAAFQNDPVGTIEANVQGTQNLLEWGKRQGMERFLLLSSGEVYGQLTDAESFTEEMQGYVNPGIVRSCYPLGKRMAENLCIAYKEQYQTSVVIARPCHTYGANVTGQDNRATAQFLSKAAAGEDIVLKSKGEQIRSYIYVADCTSAILSILLNGTNGEIYNIANTHAKVSIAGFAEETARLAGQKVVFAHNDSVENPMKYAVLNAAKLENLGWRGSYSIESGIRSSLEILQQMR